MTRWIMGSLARSGKVRYQTPKIEQTNTDTSYKGGRSKYKEKSSSNVEYSGGARRLEQVFTEELELYEKYKEGHQRCDWIEERINSKRAEPVLLNSHHKYNCDKGYSKIEWNAKHHEENADKLYFKTRKGPEASNHKKWHRNHPKDGFYQKRTVDAQDLEDDEVIEFSHLYE